MVNIASGRGIDPIRSDVMFEEHFFSTYAWMDFWTEKEYVDFHASFLEKVKKHHPSVKYLKECKQALLSALQEVKMGKKGFRERKGPIA